MGFLVLIPVIINEPIRLDKNLILGALAGIFGFVGLLALYRGLSSGRMGIVAPLSAMIGAFGPVIISALAEGIPKQTQIAGFAVALISVWLISWTGSYSRIEVKELAFSLISGICFGAYFTIIELFSNESILWPIAASRLASVSLASIIIIVLKPLPGSNIHQLPLLALLGVLDSTGNLCFALATRTGRLDIAVILGSLYPAVTVLLAYWFLHERFTGRQWFGVLLALSAVLLIST